MDPFRAPYTSRNEQPVPSGYPALVIERTLWTMTIYMRSLEADCFFFVYVVCLKFSFLLEVDSYPMYVGFTFYYFSVCLEALILNPH